MEPTKDNPIPAEPKKPREAVKPPLRVLPSVPRTDEDDDTMYARALLGYAALNGSTYDDSVWDGVEW